MGKLVVLEGLDGSGKTTQTGLLAERLSRQGKVFREVSFPDYASPSSALVKMYLAGEFGSSPGDVNAYAASAFYAVDRYASYQKSWRRFYEEGGLVLCNRYTTSNAIHQCAKLPAAQRGPFADWLYDFEFARLGIPRPNAVIYLDSDPEVSQRLMTGRYSGDEAKKDIHERDLAYQRQSRQAALWCCENLGWAKVGVCERGEMRKAEEIADEIYAILCKKGLV